MLVYESLLESVNREKKDNLAGQLSLFDMGDEELDHADRITYPDVGEYDREEFLNFEKEVLGIYISGHPLEEYIGLMEKNCTRTSQDFLADADSEGMGMANVEDGETVIIGGLLTGNTIKTTRNNSLMAFLTMEDLYGTVEVIVFPGDYEKYKSILNEDSKIFVKGRATVEEDRGGKLICREIIPFDKVPCELWIRFPDIASFQQEEKNLYQKLSTYDGQDPIYIYAVKEKQVKRLSQSRKVDARKVMEQGILSYLGEGSAAIREKSIEK